MNHSVQSCSSRATSGHLLGDGMVGVVSDESQRAVVQQSCNKRGVGTYVVITTHAIMTLATVTVWYL